VILLDLQLPDSTGLATLRTLTAHTSAPVIVLTVLDDPSLSREAIKMGREIISPKA
jgi:DNA-binding NarL/FixJ family response regulator